MSITDLTAYKQQAAQRLEPNERRKLEAIEAASLENLAPEKLERIKRDPGLGTYPYMRLVIAASKRMETALRCEAAERKAEVERQARNRL